ncbi:hypothetical protein MASR1M48_16860 [Lactococcus petauri]
MMQKNLNTKDKKNKIFKLAWKKWGETLQIAITIEELSELATALSRILRGRYKPWDDAVITEIADAYIVLDSYVSQYNLDGLVNVEINKKLERLKARVEGE